LISTKFYVNNATSIGNQTAKFRLNLRKQTTVTAVFVRSPQNTSVSACLRVWRHPQRPENDVFWGQLTKATV